MKRSVIILGMILSMAAAVAQDFYTIQVRSLSRETPLTMEELQAGMWQHKVGGQTKCFMGRYDTYSLAKSALVELADKYTGAFVVSSEKIFDSNVPDNASATVQPKKAPAPAKAEPTKSVSTTNKIYTVQIAAYRYPLYTKEFNLEEDVMEFYCSDNIYRYTVGKMNNEAAARELLKKIKGSGYPDAFLIDYMKYEVYRIE